LTVTTPDRSVRTLIDPAHTEASPTPELLGKSQRYASITYRVLGRELSVAKTVVWPTLVETEVIVGKF
jgi:hypothetical protein